MSRNATISARTLTLVGFLLAFVICYLYAHSVTVVYGVLELSIAAICYIGCLKYYRMIDGNFLVLNCGAVLLAWCAGLFSGDFKSTLLITVPLLMPLYISALEIRYKDWTDYVPVSLVAVAITCLAVETDLFGEINSNSLGFLGFMGASFGVLWLIATKRKLIPAALVLFGLYCAIQSGSRNVAVVSLICVALLLLPKGIFKKPIVYFSICLGAILYSVFSADIIAWIFSKPKLSEFLVEYTSRYSEKAWEMLGRVDFLESLQKKITQRDILLQLFGTGTHIFHAHNMFLQCILNFGYVGTALIYAGFCRLFKLAHILIDQKQDDVALGCVIILWGSFLLQGADVFVIGPEAYAVIPQLIMGIILNRYRVYRNEWDETESVEICEQSASVA